MTIDYTSLDQPDADSPSDEAPVCKAAQTDDLGTSSSPRAKCHSSPPQERPVQPSNALFNQIRRQKRLSDRNKNISEELEVSLVSEAEPTSLPAALSMFGKGSAVCLHNKKQPCDNLLNMNSEGQGQRLCPPNKEPSCELKDEINESPSTSMSPVADPETLAPSKSQRIIETFPDFRLLISDEHGHVQNIGSDDPLPGQGTTKGGLKSPRVRRRSVSTSQTSDGRHGVKMLNPTAYRLDAVPSRSKEWLANAKDNQSSERKAQGETPKQTKHGTPERAQSSRSEEQDVQRVPTARLPDVATAATSVTSHNPLLSRMSPAPPDSNMGYYLPPAPVLVYHPYFFYHPGMIYSPWGMQPPMMPGFSPYEHMSRSSSSSPHQQLLPWSHPRPQSQQTQRSTSIERPVASQRCGHHRGQSADVVTRPRTITPQPSVQASRCHANVWSPPSNFLYSTSRRSPTPQIGLSNIDRSETWTSRSGFIVDGRDEKPQHHEDPRRCVIPVVENQGQTARSSQRYEPLPKKPSHSHPVARQDGPPANAPTAPAAHRQHHGTPSSQRHLPLAALQGETGSWSQSKRWTSREAKERMAFQKMMLNLHHIGADKSPCIPRTSTELTAFRAEMAEDQKRQLTVKMSRRLNRARPKKEGSIPLFRGTEFADGLSPFFAADNCFNKAVPTRSDGRVDWPCLAELKEEGDKRALHYGRYFPLPRLNIVADRISEQDFENAYNEDGTIRWDQKAVKLGSGEIRPVSMPEDLDSQQTSEISPCEVSDWLQILLEDIDKLAIPDQEMPLGA